MKLAAVLVTAVTAATVAAGAVVSATDWPQFRGKDAAGVAAGTSVTPIQWRLSPDTGIAWKTAIPGLAHSSPIVWGDRVYLTTAVAAEGKPRIVLGDVHKSGIDPATDTG